MADDTQACDYRPRAETKRSHSRPGCSLWSGCASTCACFFQHAAFSSVYCGIGVDSACFSGAEIPPTSIRRQALFLNGSFLPSLIPHMLYAKIELLFSLLLSLTTMHTGRG